MFCLKYHARYRPGRRITSGLLLATFVVTAMGVPIPTGRGTKQSGELFPCSACGCGCDSAERCWSDCCCHTLVERLAWAEKHGEKPPDFALEQAARAGLDAGGRPLTPRLVKLASAADSCCSAKGACYHDATPNCCRAKLASRESSTADSCCSSHAKPQDNDDDDASFVVGWRALACHGQSLHWLAAVPTLISVRPELSDQLPLVAWLGPVISDGAEGVTDRPSIPPPERA